MVEEKTWRRQSGDRKRGREIRKTSKTEEGGGHHDAQRGSMPTNNRGVRGEKVERLDENERRVLGVRSTDCC